jgi:hypothetical protein
MSIYTDECAFLTRIENAFGLDNSVYNYLLRDDINILLGNNKATFIKVWGRQTTTFTSEYRHWIWRFEQNVDGKLMPWYVLSGERGTSIEVCSKMPTTIRLEILKTILQTLKAQ